MVRDRTDQSGSFNVHAITMTNTNESMTEYWALAADYKNKVKLTLSHLKSPYLIKFWFRRLISISRSDFDFEVKFLFQGQVSI